jgi:hypothetical protein
MKPVKLAVSQVRKVGLPPLLVLQIYAALSLAF